jgi:ribosomal-protein-alanine N-acetyltransferase
MNFPFIKTKRLTLRPFVAEDSKQIYNGLASKDRNSIVRFYGIEFYTLEDSQMHFEWFDALLRENKGIWWGINYNSEQGLLGACGFYNTSKQHKKTKIEFWLMPDYWHQGIMTEALPSIVGYAFDELGMHRVEAFIESENQFTKELLLKVGFKHEGTMVDCKVKHGKFISLDIFAIIKP